ncbi:MAG: hypothetical protein BWX99_02986 [Deltaproteobacteria bacterium ADurb.Bin151]|nr:MAG: hypothetical protein BWX99_02986 [Deltaproteobacteria bacterium ADurb.Bin151]
MKRVNHGVCTMAFRFRRKTIDEQTADQTSYRWQQEKDQRTELHHACGFEDLFTRRCRNGITRQQMKAKMTARLQQIIESRSPQSRHNTDQKAKHQPARDIFQKETSHPADDLFYFMENHQIT